MLVRVNKLLNEILIFIDLEGQRKDRGKNFSKVILTRYDTKQIQYLIDILAPFAVFTNAIGATVRGATVQYVYQVYNELFDHMEKFSTKLERKRQPWKVAIRRGLTNAKAKLSKYYSGTHHQIGYTYAIATLLSPEQKTTTFEKESWQEADGSYQWV